VEGYGCEPVIRVQGVIAIISGGHAQYRDSGGDGYLFFQPVKAGINYFGLPLGVREYRVVDLRKDALG
jgi:hypothetical protein